MNNIRKNLKLHLLSQSSITILVGTRITAIARPQASALPALVFRVIKMTRGETLRSDSGERSATFELVVWANTQEECCTIAEALNELYHGTGQYDFGDISVHESSNLQEFDGDRVLDVFSDEGAVAITTVFEFIWDV